MPEGTAHTLEEAMQSGNLFYSVLDRVDAHYQMVSRFCCIDAVVRNNNRLYKLNTWAFSDKHAPGAGGVHMVLFQLDGTSSDCFISSFHYATIAYVRI